MAHVANATGSLTAATSSVLGGFPRLPHASRTIPLFPRFSHLPLAPFGTSCALRHSAKTESCRDLMAIPSPACWPRGPGTGRGPVGRNGVGGSHAELSTRPGAGLDRAAWHQDLCPLAIVFLVDRLRGGRAAGLRSRRNPGGARRCRRRRHRLRGSRPADRPRQPATTYGSARWADAADISARRALRNAGVVLGLYDDRYLRHDGPEHVLAGRADALRQRRRPGAPDAFDLARLGRRSRHQGRELAADRRLARQLLHCLLFDPTNPRPPASIRCWKCARARTEVRDVQNIADILVDPEGARERRDHWEKTATPC